MKEIIIRCYVEQMDGYWQAGCIDLDIFVDGDTREDAKQALHEALNSFVETVNSLPVKDQKRLLNRKAPLSVRISYALKHIYFYGFRPRSAKGREDYISESLCPA